MTKKENVKGKYYNNVYIKEKSLLLRRGYNGSNATFLWRNRMDDYTSPAGKTTIDPGVLIQIARLTALSVGGVSKMASGSRSLDNVLKKKYSDGVLIDVENNTVYADLYVVMNYDADIYKTGQTIQRKVHRAITEMVGMDIGHINVHIEDIDYQGEK